MCRRFSSVYKAELLTLTGYYLWFPSVKSFELESSTSGIWLILRAGPGYKMCCLDDQFCLAKLLGRQSTRALFPRPVFFLSSSTHFISFLSIEPRFEVATTKVKWRLLEFGGKIQDADQKRTREEKAKEDRDESRL